MKRILGRIVLSGLIVFHLSAILLAPNSRNYLGEKVGWLISPYTNFFGLAARWAFFAPEPGPPLFVDWEILDFQGNRLENGRFPESPSPYFLQERQNRRVAIVEFMIESDVRTERMMLPYLCKTQMKAHSVRLWRTYFPSPSIMDVAEGKRSFADEVQVERRLVSHSYCYPGST